MRKWFPHLHNNGPPLSPEHVSILPCRCPAQNIFFVIDESLYWFLHSCIDTIGTSASFKISLPSSSLLLILPQPMIVQVPSGSGWKFCGKHANAACFDCSTFSGNINRAMSLSNDSFSSYLGWMMTRFTWYSTSSSSSTSKSYSPNRTYIFRRTQCAAVNTHWGVIRVPPQNAS